MGRILVALGVCVALASPLAAQVKQGPEGDLARDLIAQPAQPAEFPPAVDRVAALAGGAVPAPADWVLMILGFTGAGAVLRSRRRRPADR